MIAGVCSGIGEYLGVDKTVVRLLWALLTVLTALVGGTLAYLVAWFVIPPEPAR